MTCAVLKYNWFTDDINTYLPQLMESLPLVNALLHASHCIISDSIQALVIGIGYWVQVFLAWFSIAQTVCQWAFSLPEIRFQRPWVWILHSAEEDNWSPFDSISRLCCQCIKINTNKNLCQWNDYMHTQMYTIPYKCVFHKPSENLLPSEHKW